MAKKINGYELDEEENLKQMEEVDALATDLLNNVGVGKFQSLLDALAEVRKSDVKLYKAGKYSIDAASMAADFMDILGYVQDYHEAKNQRQLQTAKNMIERNQNVC